MSGDKEDEYCTLRMGKEPGLAQRRAFSFSHSHFCEGRQWISYAFNSMRQGVNDEVQVNVPQVAHLDKVACNSNHFGSPQEQLPMSKQGARE